MRVAVYVDNYELVLESFDEDVLSYIKSIALKRVSAPEIEMNRHAIHPREPSWIIARNTRNCMISRHY